MTSLRAKKINSPRILFILTLPPPAHGSNLINKIIWETDWSHYFSCQLLDISDHRDIRNIGHFDLPNIYLALKKAWELRQLLRKSNPDLVYLPIAQNTPAFLRDSLFIHLIQAGRPPHPRIAIHLHGSRFRLFYESSSPVLRVLIRCTLSRVKAAIILSPRFIPIFSPWIKNIYVVPNGLDFVLPAGSKEKRESKPEKMVTITYLSNLLVAKGIVDWLRAIPSLKKKYPQAQFKIAGEIWTEKKDKKRKQQIIQTNLTEVCKLEGVSYLGPVDQEEKQRLLAATDIYVLPSYDEGQPLSLIEAMAASCAIVATSVGAIPDMIEDGRSGLLLPPGVPQLLIEKVCQLIENISERQALARAARARYEKQYTKEAFINRLRETFYLILETG
ncbi:MAG: glycosyltransferase family 4 protein [Candidatus Aminicenantales bacterium]